MKFLDNRIQIKSLDSGVIEGYASVFGNVDYQQESIAKGAFRKSLEKYTSSGEVPKMLWQHDQRSPIGIWDEIYEDNYGLFARGHILLDIQKGRDAYSLLKSKAVDGLSIGFQVKQSHKESGVKVLDEVELFEISLVTFTANPAAKVTLCKERFCKTPHSWEDSYAQTIYLVNRLKNLRKSIQNSDFSWNNLISVYL
ncbi:MAG: HK97 family phage prohead protease [Holosporales bacterium]|jgi:HK97 family phage prohead protease|nr:HK97 family phage prohead protease [Holosporales bacterium]